MTRGHHNVLDNYTQADTCTGLDLARRVRPDGRHPGAQSLPDSDRNRLVATLVGPAQEKKPVMSRLAIAFVFPLAATAAYAQDTQSGQPRTPAVASANGAQPFLKP
jgi:hypothetical protein